MFVRGNWIPEDSLKSIGKFPGSGYLRGIHFIAEIVQAL
jgi:hypothetical protein